MKKDFQEAIDDYVLGNMSAKDRSVFEKEASQEEEIQEQLELTQNVCNAIKSRHEKLVMMQKWEEQSADSSRKLMRWASSVIGIAAVFLFGFFLFIPKEKESRNFKYEGMKTYGKTNEQQTFYDIVQKEYVIAKEGEKDKFIQLQPTVESFATCLSVIGDKNSPASAKETMYKRALKMFMDVQTAKALGKGHAKVLFEQKNGNTETITIDQYLQRLKHGIESSWILKKIEIHKVDKASICEMSNGLYKCNIETFMLFLDIESNVQNGLRKVKTITIDSQMKEVLEEKGYVYLGNVEIHK